MSKKKIEPTDAMVKAVAFEIDIAPATIRAILRAALNHPDAPGLFADEDDRPWEPLNGPVRVGDEVRQEAFGFAVTAVVARMDGRGDPLTAEGAIIGDLRHGTWYVRRPIQELPPERDGVVLVAADGHESITTTDGQEFSRLTYSKELSKWYGPNLAQLGEYVIQTTSLSRLIPGTWKVGDQ